MLPGLTGNPNPSTDGIYVNVHKLACQHRQASNLSPGQCRHEHKSKRMQICGHAGQTDMDLSADWHGSFSRLTGIFQQTDMDLSADWNESFSRQICIFQTTIHKQSNMMQNGKWTVCKIERTLTYLFGTYRAFLEDLGEVSSQVVDAVILLFHGFGDGVHISRNARCSQTCFITLIGSNITLKNSG